MTLTTLVSGILMAAVTIRTGTGWTPVSGEARVTPGSAMDFSEARHPAGTFGRVVAKGAHFEFERLPGIRQRFYGINLCGTANFMDDERLAALLTRLAQTGYNAIRIHHHETGLCRGTADGATINPERMERLDALLAEAGRRGFYVTTDLYVSRPVPYRSCGIDKDGTFNGSEYKESALCHEGVRSNLFAFTRALLNHRNPHTGLRWADDPTLAWLSLINEGNPGNRGKALTRKVFGLSEAQADDAALARQVLARQKEFDRACIALVKGELGYRGLVSNLNGWTNPPEYQEARQAYDYVDDHFYLAHPDTFQGAAKIGKNTNPLVSPDGIRGYSGPKGRYHWTWCRPVRLPDRPLTVSEWNFSSPARYRGLAGLMMGTGAAALDFAAMWRFTWCHKAERAFGEHRTLGFFDVSVDPVMRAGERAMAAIYLRGDFDNADSDFAFDKKLGTLRTWSPRTCGVFAEASDTRHAAGALEVCIRDHFATVWATSVDGVGLKESRRILLTHLTDVQDDGNTYSDDMTQLLHWGRLPHIMANGRVDVALRHNTPKRLSVWALDADGTRVAPVKAEAAGGTLRFVADVARDPKMATFSYEITAD